MNVIFLDHCFGQDASAKNPANLVITVNGEFGVLRTIGMLYASGRSPTLVAAGLNHLFRRRTAGPTSQRHHHLRARLSGRRRPRRAPRVPVDRPRALLRRARAGGAEGLSRDRAHRRPLHAGPLGALGALHGHPRRSEQGRLHDLMRRFQIIANSPRAFCGEEDSLKGTGRSFSVPDERCNQSLGATHLLTAHA